MIDHAIVIVPSSTTVLIVPVDNPMISSAKDANAATALLPATFSLIDRAAKIGIIKKNTAARYKSNLHLKEKSLSPSAAK